MIGFAGNVIVQKNYILDATSQKEKFFEYRQCTEPTENFASDPWQCFSSSYNETREADRGKPMCIWEAIPHYMKKVCNMKLYLSESCL